MRFFQKFALAACFACAAGALGASLARAAPLAGLSLAAPSIRLLERPSVESLVPDDIHYKRYPHRHPTYYGWSFYRHFYGDWPRYSYPSYIYRLDEYTYFYPPFYW